MLLSESSIRKIIRRLFEIDTANVGSSNIRSGSGSSSSSNGDDIDISEDDLKDINVEDLKGKLKVLGAKRSANIKSVRKMAAATGLRIDFVYGIQTRESGGAAKAMALNPHLLSVPNTRYATDVGIDENERKRIINEWKAKGVETRKPSVTGKKYSGSYFNAHKSPNNEIFTKMFKISPTGTITGAALGLYQVLGYFMLGEYGNNGNSLYNDFQANPIKYSQRAFIKWVNHKSNSKFKRLVNSGENNWSDAVAMYYGQGSTDYINHVKEYAKYFRQSVDSFKKKANNSRSGKDSWKGRLGKETARDINFHKLIKGGSNNYRSGMKPKHVNANKEFFKGLKKDFNIDTVITLNSDFGGKAASDAAKAAGLKVMYAPSSDSGGSLDMRNYTFDQIERQLDKGNTLIHCTHGADRTGAVIGRYYIRKGMAEADALANTYKYKSGGKAGYEKDGMGPTNYIKLG